MHLKAYTGIDNEAFEYEDRAASLWQVTRVNMAPDPGATISSASTTSPNGRPADVPVMEQLTVENLRKLNNKTMAFGETKTLDTITEESSMWSQESVVI